MDSDLKSEVLEEIKKEILFGFEDQEQVFEDVCEMFYGEPLDKSWLQAEIAKEFDIRKKESVSWQRPTDFEKLVKVFDQLNREKIISLHKAGHTRQDGESDCISIIKELESAETLNIKGYCYYHAQDLERAIKKNGNLYIGYNGYNQDDTLAKQVANRIVELLQTESFKIDWSGSLDDRIKITEIDWKKLPDTIDYNYDRVFENVKKGISQKEKTTKPFWKFW